MHYQLLFYGFQIQLLLNPPYFCGIHETKKVSQNSTQYLAIEFPDKEFAAALTSLSSRQTD